MSANVDQYTFLKNLTSNIKDNRYKSKEWVFINDNSNGNYSSNQVVFDTSTLANSSTFTNWEEGFIVLPMIGVLSQDNAAGLSRSDYALQLKAVNAALISSVSIDQGGKTMVSNNPKLNLYNTFNSIVNCSKESEQTKEHLGLVLDDSQTWSYNTTFAPKYAGLRRNVVGNGFCNNCVITEDGLGTAVASVAGLNVGPLSNHGALRRCRINNKNIVSSNSVLSRENIQRELQPYTVFTGTGNEDQTQTAGSSNHQVYYWFPIIRLRDITNLFSELGLIKGAYFRMTLNLNLGSAQVRYDGTAGTNVLWSHLGESTFLNYCPLQMNTNQTFPTTSGTARNFAIGLYCGTVLSSIQSVSPNHSSMGISASPMQQCRLYVPQVVLHIDAEILYLSKMKKKRIQFDDVFNTQLNNVGPNSTFSYNVSNSMKGAYSILVIPSISQSVHGNATGNWTTALNGAGAAGPIERKSFSYYLSPFGSNSPCPLSIGQFQVNVGGKSLFPNYMNYTFEHWIEQVNGFRSINGNQSDTLESSLISKKDWETLYRYYVASWVLESPNDSFSITISGMNNSALAADYDIFVISRRECVVDAESGDVLSSTF